MSSGYSCTILESPEDDDVNPFQDDGCSETALKVLKMILGYSQNVLTLST